MGMFSSLPPPMGMMGPPGMGNYPNMRPFPPYGMVSLVLLYYTYFNMDI